MCASATSSTSLLKASAHSYRASCSRLVNKVRLMPPAASCTLNVSSAAAPAAARRIASSFLHLPTRKRVRRKNVSAQCERVAEVPNVLTLYGAR